VQKRIDEAWRAEAEEVYAGYVLYHQSASLTEQHSFDASTGVGLPRSVRILDQLARLIPFSTPGRMLDLGCGIGVTLRAFNKVAPTWSLEGIDPNLKDRGQVLSIPGVVGVHGGDLADLDGRYDCVTCMHVLEHVVDPLTLLSQARDLLTPTGVLLIQIPNYHENYFDLAITDHCTHFSPETVGALLGEAGFEVLLNSTDIVSREITVVAKRGSPTPGAANGVDLARDQWRSVSAGLTWLEAVESAGQTASMNSPFGIFGTSIAATWLAPGMIDRVEFFVDEDMSRVGGSHLGKPIVAPDHIPSGAHVFLALVPKVADAVAKKLSGLECRTHSPPPWPV
jgi:SAM-dependent methyltransferase